MMPSIPGVGTPLPFRIAHIFCSFVQAFPVLQLQLQKVQIVS